MKRILLLGLVVCVLLSCGCRETSASELPAEESVYTVSFDTRGGSAVASQEVAHGYKVREPEAPTKFECEFAGWYVGDERWSFIGYSVTEDITLTARWIEWYTFGLSDKEIELLRGLSWFDVEEAPPTWQDVKDITKEYCEDRGIPCVKYTVKFKDGRERVFLVASEVE